MHPNSITLGVYKLTYNICKKVIYSRVTVGKLLTNQEGDSPLMHSGPWGW